ncbi:MAG: transglycosylase SLT domain-containing protein [Acidobacteriota bacterium]
MMLVLFALQLCAQANARYPLRQTFDAVCMAESAGDPRAYNPREDAAGIAQIRPIMVQDCNRIIGHAKYSLADRWNPAKSWEMFRLYSLYYAPRGTPEIWSRNWCGGPDGHRQGCTLAYWRKVQAAMK